MNSIGTSSYVDRDKFTDSTGGEMGMAAGPGKSGKGIALLMASMASILFLLSLAQQATSLTAQAAARDAEGVQVGQQDRYPTSISAVTPATNAGTRALEEETRAIWSISWTATAKAYSLTTDSSGAELLVDRQTSMSGFAIRREYIDRPWVKFNMPFNMTYTSESHRVNRRYCVNGGEERNEEHTWITDPGRYSSGPDSTPAISRWQRADGSWYIPDPFLNGGGFSYCAGLECEDRNFTAHRIYGWTTCDGTASQKRSAVA